MCPALVGVRARERAGRAAGAFSRLAVQLGLPVGALASYGSRAQTRTDHLKPAANRLGWATAETDDRAG
ncbi:MAG: hypothetical protein ACRDRO_13095 [Pseudonocardiaceae bacterium]